MVDSPKIFQQEIAQGIFLLPDFPVPCQASPPLWVAVGRGYPEVMGGWVAEPGHLALALVLGN